MQSFLNVITEARHQMDLAAVDMSFGEDSLVALYFVCDNHDDLGVHWVKEKPVVYVVLARTLRSC